MHVAGTRPWMMSWRFGSTLDFCVWLLEHDGLHVPPFTAHPVSPGAVSAGALTADTWRTLVVAVANALDFTSGVPGRRWPHQLWRGDATVGERLRRLWQDSYIVDVSGARAERSQKRYAPTGLFDEIEPYRQYLPDKLRIELIDYPVPVSWLCTPGTLLLSTAYNSLGDDEIRSMIFQALDEQAVEAGANGDWKERYWQSKREQEPAWNSLLAEIPPDQQAGWPEHIERFRKATIDVQNLLFSRYRMMIALYRQGPRTGIIQAQEQLIPNASLVAIKIDDVVFSTHAAAIHNPDKRPLEVGQSVEVEVKSLQVDAPAISYRLV